MVHKMSYHLIISLKLYLWSIVFFLYKHTQIRLDITSQN